MPFLIEGDDETVGHYVCFVINCDLKRIQYLDNRPHDEGLVFRLAGVLVSVCGHIVCVSPFVFFLCFVCS